MKTEIKFDKEILKSIVEKSEEGLSKNEISGWLVEELKVFEDPSKFNQIEKYLRKSNVKFRKSSGNWDEIINYFDESENPSKDGMIERLQSYGMTEVQSKKYGSSYWYVLNEIYKLEK